MAYVAPSILAADFSRIEDEVLMMEEFGAQYIHLDVMDGKFVPNTTFGPDLVERIHDIHHMVNDVHLMVADPVTNVIDFAKAGADILTVHYESFACEKDLDDGIDLIHMLGKKAGVSVKPNTNIEVLQPFWEKMDLCLVMSVEPGKGGQAYLDSADQKLSWAKMMNQKHPGHHVLIEVDGGINGVTGPIAVAAGAEILVAGSYLFGKADAKERLEGLLAL